MLPTTSTGDIEHFHFYEQQVRIADANNEKNKHDVCVHCCVYKWNVSYSLSNAIDDSDVN